MDFLFKITKVNPSTECGLNDKQTKAKQPLCRWTLSWIKLLQCRDAHSGLQGFSDWSAIQFIVHLLVWEALELKLITFFVYEGLRNVTRTMSSSNHIYLFYMFKNINNIIMLLFQYKYFYAHRGCIYLIKKWQKTIILWNIFTIEIWIDCFLF